jgi:hypothetical protein
VYRFDHESPDYVLSGHVGQQPTPAARDAAQAGDPTAQPGYQMLGATPPERPRISGPSTEVYVIKKLKVAVLDHVETADWSSFGGNLDGHLWAGWNGGVVSGGGLLGTVGDGAVV